MKKPYLLIAIAGIMFTLGCFGLVWLKSYESANKPEDNKKVLSRTISDVIYRMTGRQVLKPPKKNNDSSPDVQAKAVYLIDVPTFYPMYAKNESEKLPIASTTKIATAMVVLEDYHSHLDDVVNVNSKMINVTGAKINLKLGEKITVRNILYGMLINSGNDAAYTLAEYFGGKEKFVAQMNAKVKKIGLENTQYQDPAGLDDDGYSTAKDLATLSAYALRNSEFSEIVKTSKKTISSTDGLTVHELSNSNRLLQNEDPYYYPYSIGVKTGFTYAAGHVLVSAAEKDGHRILGVVMNTNENTAVASAKESKKLLEWGFANWSW